MWCWLLSGRGSGREPSCGGTDPALFLCTKDTHTHTHRCRHTYEQAWYRTTFSKQRCLWRCKALVKNASTWDSIYYQVADQFHLKALRCDLTVFIFALFLNRSLWLYKTSKILTVWLPQIRHSLVKEKSFRVCNVPCFQFLTHTQTHSQRGKYMERGSDLDVQKNQYIFTFLALSAPTLHHSNIPVPIRHPGSSTAAYLSCLVDFTYRWKPGE